MDVATGQNYLAKAVRVGAESQAYIEGILAELPRKLEQRPGKNRPASYAEKVAFGYQIQRVLKPIVDHLFAKAEEMVSLVKLALEVESVVPLGEFCWQMCLVSLENERVIIGDFCKGPARSASRRHNGMEAGWPDEWDARCDEFLERVEDLCETIAIGLNEELRGTIEERIEDIRAAAKQSG